MLTRAVIVVLVVFATACGSDDGGRDKTSAGETSDAPASETTGGRSSEGEEIDLTEVDACSLIDEPTVQGLTGESTRFASQDLGRDTCFWGATRAGVGAYVELKVFRQPDGLSAYRINLGQKCSVAPSSAVGEEAEVATCPAGGGAPQSKVQLRAFERGVIVTLLVNDASGPVAAGELARVVGSVFSQLG